MRSSSTGPVPIEELGPARFRLGLHPVAAAAIVLALVVLAFAGIARASGSGESASFEPVESSRGQAQSAAVSPEVDDIEAQPVEVPSNPAEAPEKLVASQHLVVFVTGAVKEPGVVEVPSGSRAEAAVLAAGGLTSDALMTSVNLASLVSDGDHIHVAVEGEIPAVTLIGPVGGGVAQGTEERGCIDLNTATETTLQELDGVGPKIAARIFEHREAVGGFSSVEELRSVSGIGPVLLERIRVGLCD